MQREEDMVPVMMTEIRDLPLEKKKIQVYLAEVTVHWYTSDGIKKVRKAKED